ncbi:MAG: 2-C-methyl-D-erythritol 4-phosphate cytidylyltransferase [Phycisphaeraceae bacterium]|nr:2-C-methyl-D-erythritol 4-phosphate cytidylyltransferase [Phycisphaeraceae bacterium]
MNLAVIIPAAGFSTRYAEALKAETATDLARSKLDEDLGGRPVLQRTVELFANHDAVQTIIVAGPNADAAPEAWSEFKNRYADKLGLLGVKLCQGGRTHRYETVLAALALVPDDATHIAVHDAARPCTPPELLDRLFDAAQKYPAVIPGVDVPDTLKRTTDRETDDREVDPLDAILGTAGKRNTRVREVETTIDRARLIAVQTPQVFHAPLLRRAYAQTNLLSPPPTDDAQIVERMGEKVTVVQGDPRNLKITLPSDLSLARAILGVRGPESRPVHKRF